MHFKKQGIKTHLKVALGRDPQETCFRKGQLNTDYYVK